MSASVRLAVLAGGVALVVGHWLVRLPDDGWLWTAAVYFIVSLVLLMTDAERLRPADLVTFARLTLVCFLVGGVSTVAPTGALGWVLTAIAGVALALDAVDGWVARRAGPTEFGARFDMEVDALLGLVVCLLLAPKVGVWVLAIGLARYVFVASGWAWSALAAELPPSGRRRAVCAAQMIALVVALGPVVPPALAAAIAALALAATAASFGADVAWLLRRA